METIRKLDPTVWNHKNWHRFFLLAAFWNFAGAIPGIFFPAWSMKFFYAAVPSDDYHALLGTSLFWGSVFVFGIGYLIVAGDPEKNSGILVMGVMGKLILALVWCHTYFFCRNYSTIVVLGAATGDLIFAIYFYYYLVTKTQQLKQKNKD